MAEHISVPKHPKDPPQKRRKSLMMNILFACGLALASQSELDLVPSTHTDHTHGPQVTEQNQQLITTNTSAPTAPQKHQAPSRAGYVNERGHPGMASRTEQGQPPIQFASKREQRQI